MAKKSSKNTEYWEKIGTWMFRKSTWVSAKSQTEELISLLKLEQSEKILDMCCGPGRHSLELARKGYQRVEPYSDLKGSPYDNQAARLVVLAYK